MKKIFLALSLGLAVTACKKESTELPVAAPADKKLVEYRNLTANEKRSYSYDSQGKMIKVESNTHSWTFEYLPSKLVVRAHNINTGALLSTTEHSLDAAGRATSATLKNASGEWTYTQQFEYDANGYLVKEKTNYADGDVHEIFYTIAAGNVVKQVYKRNGLLDDETDYTYDLSIPAKLYATMVSDWQIGNLYGKGFTNVMKGYKRYDETGTLVFERINTHTLDARGYVTKLTSYYPITNKTYDYEYIYQ